MQIVITNWNLESFRKFHQLKINLVEYLKMITTKKISFILAGLIQLLIFLLFSSKYEKSYETSPRELFLLVKTIKEEPAAVALDSEKKVKKSKKQFFSIKPVESEDVKHNQNQRSAVLSFEEKLQEPITIIPDSIDNSNLVIEKAKKDLKQIDKELRGKAPIVAAQQTGRFSKLARSIERAYIGSNSNDWRGYYESPDGITYFTETVKGTTRCWMNGPVSSPSGKSNGATSINCPSSASWRKY